MSELYRPVGLVSMERDLLSDALDGAHAHDALRIDDAAVDLDGPRRRGAGADEAVGLFARVAQAAEVDRAGARARRGGRGAAMLDPERSEPEIVCVRGGDETERYAGDDEAEGVASRSGVRGIDRVRGPAQWGIGPKNTTQVTKSSLKVSNRCSVPAATKNASPAAQS